MLDLGAGEQSQKHPNDERENDTEEKKRPVDRE